MILSQTLIVRALTGRPIGAAERAAAVATFRACRTAEGGFGQHPESHAYVFYTALAYVALRLCGLGPDDPLCADARRFLQRVPGGVLAVPTWGKAWLALCGLYGWEGVNPTPPELFLLPRWTPVHPRGFYCHTRHIYEALAYLAGARFVGDLGPLREALREELYGLPYDAIDFARHRHHLAATDVYVRPGAGLRRAYDAAAALERLVPPPLRRRALVHTHAEVEATLRESRYLALSPVSGLLGALVLFARDPRDPGVDRVLEALDAWRFEDAAGLRYAGARSDVWDTAFAMEALLAAPSRDEAQRRALAKAHEHLRRAQLPAAPTSSDRQAPGGGWCFGGSAHGWPVSDCTAEALAALLSAEAEPQVAPLLRPLADARVVEAVEFLLARQHRDGGFGSYERRRGPAWLERFNPSELFGACVVERSYIECTASALVALAAVATHRPHLLGADARRAMAAAQRFLRRAQRPDGTWEGFWGIHLTYGTFHGVRALRAAGVPPEDPALRRAAAGLGALQRPDGAFGEHFEGPLRGAYAPHAEGQPVMTAWALLALLELRGADDAAVRRGLDWLRAAQQPAGDFPEGAVNGVFFGAAMLHYRFYPQVFPCWALAKAEAGRSAARQPLR